MKTHPYLADLAPLLPKASGTKDFVILGSKGGFIMMLAAVGALAIIAGIAIILVIRKNSK